MKKITVGVLTVSDRCASKVAVDESGPKLVEMIRGGVIGSAEVVKTGLLPDEKDEIQEAVKEWCSQGIHLILTTGGTGVGTRDVTPEATIPLLDKQIPGMTQLIFNKSSSATPLAALSRGVAGVRGRSLIINLPGSKKASSECLEAVAAVIPHAVHLVTGSEQEVAAVHAEMGRRKSKVRAACPAGRARKSPYPCVGVDEAQKLILSRVGVMERVVARSFDQALGFVLAENVAAKDDLPPFDTTLKDGYAVLSSDRAEIKEVVGCSNAGQPTPGDRRLVEGECVRVTTGAAIPDEADAVVQVEDTEIVLLSEDGKEEKKIRARSLPSRGQDVRGRGSDFRAGDLLLEAGSLLGASAVGLLAAAGVATVKVFDKPVVGIFSTGDELVEPTEDPGRGKVRDSNRAALGCILKEEGFPVRDLGIVRDDPDSLCDSLARGLEAVDVAVTTGSMSMGDRDYLKQVLASDFRAHICFGRVFMKPGKPTAFAVLESGGKPKLWFGLPGNPASAFATTHLFLLPALRKIARREKTLPATVSVSLPPTVPREERPHYARGLLKWEHPTGWTVKLAGGQRSSYIGNCVSANCLVEIPEEAPDGRPRSSAGTQEVYRVHVIGPVF